MRNIASLPAQQTGLSYERCHKITKEYTHYTEKQLIARMGKEHSNDFDDKPFLGLLFVTKYMNNLISLVICAFLFVIIK